MYKLDENSAHYETINYDGQKQEYDETYLQELQSVKIKFSGDTRSILNKFNDKGIITANTWKGYDWIMFCISYYLQLNENINLDNLKEPDQKGIEIPIDTLFQNQIPFWTAFISEQMFLSKPDKTDWTKEDFAKYIRILAHYGALALNERWEEALKYHQNVAYKAKSSFISELAEIAYKNMPKIKTERKTNDFSNTENKTIQNDNADKSKDILNALEKCKIPAESVIFSAEGMRYDIYEVKLKEPYILSNKDIEKIAQSLGKDILGESVKGKSLTLNIKILKPENEWKVFEDNEFQRALQEYKDNFELPVCLGLDELGKPVFKDYYDAPHSIIGGTTGSGKSVAIKVMLHSLLKLTPKDNLEVLILDPKKVDYQKFAEQYNNCKLIVDNNEMETIIYHLAEEMDNRYTILQERGVKKITDIVANERPFNFKVVMIDELADLLDTNEDLADPLTRLAQKGRAAGIVLILSTQRPDANALGQKGSRLRANLPTKIAFKVDKEANSKIILDETGAETLAGKGDHFIKWFGGEKVFLHGYNLKG